MTDLQTKWIKQIEGIYGASYTPEMRAEVAKRIPKSYEALKALKEAVLLEVDDRYGRVPGVKAITKCLNEIAETPAQVTHNVPLLEDHDDNREEAHELLRAVRESIDEGRDFRNDPRVLAIVERVGALPEYQQLLREESGGCGR